jgi:hypothetical protein
VSEVPADFKEPTDKEVKQLNRKEETLNEIVTIKNREESEEINKKLVEEALKGLKK